MKCPARPEVALGCGPEAAIPPVETIGAITVAIDLLKLDSDCAMPTILRKKWRDLHGHDPVQTNRFGWVCIRWATIIIVVASATCVFVALANAGGLKQTEWPWTLIWLLGILILLSGIVIFLVALRQLSKASSFAAALENLAQAFGNIAPAALYLWNWDELEVMGQRAMHKYIRTLLDDERRYNEAVKENIARHLDEDLQGDIAFRRQELKDIHAALLAFKLVDDTWNRYFEELGAEYGSGKITTAVLVGGRLVANDGDPPPQISPVVRLLLSATGFSDP